ncbi:APC family permease [Orrella sp. 11846]|uniref:APC family permease n=1 Tax=Orrella sp. 11846 TaxID=3409913 RepID=UPI003B5B940F
MVGLVVGIGIFRTPSVVASHVTSEWMFLLVWVMGGVITLVGALCYAELSSTHPDAGGEYHFLSRAYGQRIAMLFGWARCTVIQSGAIAAVAFVFGDYANQLLSLGPHGPAIYAVLSVLLVGGINVVGTVQSKQLQITVTAIVFGAITTIIGFGLLGTPTSAPPTPVVEPHTATLGMAMVFVLLTYGGWNETAYLSGELRNPQRNMIRVLVLGTCILVLFYLLVNFALLSVLGLDGLRSSDAVAADMMRQVAGPKGSTIVTVAIIVAALSTLNATAFTGARVFYSISKDLRIGGGWMGTWDERGKTPANAQIIQCGWALVLIAVGAGHPDGFAAMVNYTAPVFWGFMLLVALALFVLRWRFPHIDRPYQVPLYPLTPILFVLFCSYMLYSGILYAGQAGWIGLAVLAAGLPILLLRKTEAPIPSTRSPFL